MKLMQNLPVRRETSDNKTSQFDQKVSKYRLYFITILHIYIYYVYVLYKYVLSLCLFQYTFPIYQIYIIL